MPMTGAEACHFTSISEFLARDAIGSVRKGSTPKRTWRSYADTPVGSGETRIRAISFIVGSNRSQDDSGAKSRTFDQPHSTSSRSGDADISRFSHDLGRPVGQVH